MEECNRCSKKLSEGIEYTNIPHTDVYYCDKCLRNNQPERSKRDEYDREVCEHFKVPNNCHICGALIIMET